MASEKPEDINTTLNETIEDEEDSVVSLQEAIKDDEELEEEFYAVLGASDEENCSYPKGYMKRQALYSCLTCRKSGEENAEPAGICLACSHKCHDGHDLVELYTKRNFRCDCGTSQKFPNNPCTLHPEKDEANFHNSYNQNFNGLYCTCHKPYPDEDNQDLMFQCLMCEDWLHLNHTMKYDIPESEYNGTLICGDCVSKYDFLAFYGNLIEHGKEKNKESTEQVQDTETNEVVVDVKVDTTNESDANACLLSKHKKERLEGGIFVVEEFRDKICRCSKCTDMYKELKVSFLLDEEDCIETYEAIGKEKHASTVRSCEETINNELGKLGRVGQIEAAIALNNFKTSLGEFMRKFAEEGKVVRPEDVKEFFGNLNAKRRRLDNTGVPPNHCR